MIRREVLIGAGAALRRPPVLIAAYSTRGPAADAVRDAALAEVARTAISILGLSS